MEEKQVVDCLRDLREVERRTTLTLGTLRKMACGATPAPEGFPQFLKVGGKRVVRESDLQKFITQLGKKEGEAPPPQPDPAGKRRPGRPRKGV